MSQPHMTPPARTGILIIAHNPLASAFKACAIHALPEHAYCIETYDVKPSESPESAFQPCLELAHNLCGDQLLIMTDVIGATPYNLCVDLMAWFNNRPNSDKSAQLVTGINTPMLLRALTYRNENLNQIVKLVTTGGINGIISLPLPLHP